jgi:hypothetical protein
MRLNNKEVFFELREHLFLKDVYEHINEVNISSLSNPNIVDEIKSLKVIKLADLESFSSYSNYDYFLIFKFQDEYYFCDTELIPQFGMFSLLKILDFNMHLRKDKINNINKQ